MVFYKKSLILIACLSVLSSMPAMAETVSNNAAQMEKQGPAAEGSASPSQTQPLSPADATNSNLSPTGGEAPHITSPALSSGGGDNTMTMPQGQTAPQYEPSATTPTKGTMQGGAPQGLMQGAPQGMQGGQQGMQGTNPGLQGPPPGTPAIVPGLQGPPHPTTMAPQQGGAQNPSQGAPQQGMPSGQ